MHWEAIGSVSLSLPALFICAQGILCLAESEVFGK